MAVLRGLVTVVIGGVIAALTLGPASAANATLGSVPTEVASYVSSGGLVARLSNIYGENATGTAGLPFGATTTVGEITRVYQWTADRLANRVTDHPVQLTNNWVVPISIGGKPVGVATIWINPQTVMPELAEFDSDTVLARALPTMSASAALVHDPVSHAWLSLVDGTVTPLVAGSSGLTIPAPVASLKLAASAAPRAGTAGDPNTGLGLAIAIVAVIVVVLLVALWMTLRRKSSRPEPLAPGIESAETESIIESSAEPAEDSVEELVEDAAVELPEELAEELVVEPVDEPVEEPAVELVEEPVDEPAEDSPAEPAAEPRVSMSAKPPSPVTKPLVSKPSLRATGGPAASTKPRIQKPPAQKPPRPAEPDA